MKLIFLISSVFLATIVSTASATPFVNLDFEQATVPAGTGQLIDASLAFPGWTATIGSTVQSQVNYDNDALGGPAVSLYDRPEPALHFPLLQGHYDAFLLPSTDVPPQKSLLAQTGDIPADTRSIRLLCEGSLGPPEVFLGLNLIPMARIIGNGIAGQIDTYAGDISAYAGTTEQLVLSTKEPSGGTNALSSLFDDVSFSSSSAIPEPSSTDLLFMVMGCLLFAASISRKAGPRLFSTAFPLPSKRTNRQHCVMPGIQCERLELRPFLSLVAPASASAAVNYAGATGLGDNYAQISWTDPNTTESGYRVKWSPDGVSNWTALPDVPSAKPGDQGGTIQTTQFVFAGEKDYCRVFAYDGGGC